MPGERPAKPVRSTRWLAGPALALDSRFLARRNWPREYLGGRWPEWFYVGIHTCKVKDLSLEPGMKLLGCSLVAWCRFLMVFHYRDNDEEVASGVS